MAHGATPEDVSVGRKTRTVSPALRRAMSHRHDGKCCFPGCSNPIAEGHHVIHWARGGRTDIDNVFGLCTRHHVLVHEGAHRVEVIDGLPVFFRPDGQRVEAAPSLPRPSPTYLRRLVETQLREGLDSWSLTPTGPLSFSARVAAAALA